MLEVGATRTVTIHADRYWNDTTVNLIAGLTYSMHAVGTWSDWFIECDADGYRDDDLLHRSTQALRRAPVEPWFALMGAIGLSPLTYFRIGRELPAYVAPASGRFFCFANDLPWMYWNNRGELELTITRIA